MASDNELKLLIPNDEDGKPMSIKFVDQIICLPNGIVQLDKFCLPSNKYPSSVIRFSMAINTWVINEPDYHSHVNVWRYMFSSGKGREIILNKLKANKVDVTQLKLHLALLGIPNHLGGI